MQMKMLNMKWIGTGIIRALVFAGVSLFATGLFAAQPEVRTTKTYTGVCTISQNETEIWHVYPGGAIVVNPDKDGNQYIDIVENDPSELRLEGGTITSGTLALCGKHSTYTQYSGTMTLSSPLLADAGSVRLYGGVCTAAINFRKHIAGSEPNFQMLGGTLIADSFYGDNMKYADITFAATNAYVVTDNGEQPTNFAITVTTTPITQAPRSLSIIGTPVSGCTYALVDGLANDTFYTQPKVSVPAGWQLVRRGRQLLLAEPTSPVITTATWTGAANDGNPSTPGNWRCCNAAGEEIPGALPDANTTAFVPEGTTDFNFPDDKVIPLAELRFLGDTYTLGGDADWSGIKSGLVTKFPVTIDVNGFQLKLTEDLASAARTADLTEPGGDIHVNLLNGSSMAANTTAAGLIDDVVSGNNTSRFLCGGNGTGEFAGCQIDYDFGAGQGRFVRGVRFYTTGGGRRPKDLTVFGTADDPEAENVTWTPLVTWSDLNLTVGGWTSYLAFDNDSRYRAYRLQINENMGSDEYGNYLEFYEMEFVSVPLSMAATVTSSVAGGEVVFDVPEGQEKRISDMALTGSLKVVKTGAGTLGFGKQNQSFTGGVDVRAGIICPADKPGRWVFGGYPVGANAATTLTLHEGATLDLRSYGGWGYTTLVLDGGKIVGESDVLNPSLVFTAPSELQATGNITLSSSAGLNDLGGHELTVRITPEKWLYLNQSVLSNGTLNVASGGWFSNNVALDARTVDLKMSAAMNIAADLSVHDYVARFTSPDWNMGSAALNVYGTFTPAADCFYGCTLQDGATIDLSAKTAAWSTTSAFTSARKIVTFADNATVYVDLGDRRPGRKEKIIGWTSKPSNLNTLKFELAPGPRRGGKLCVGEDGIYYISGFVIYITQNEESIFVPEEFFDGKTVDGKSITTDALAQAYMEQVEANGLTAWQNYAMGIEGNVPGNRFDITYEKIDEETIKVKTPIAEFNPPDSGVKVTYTLLKSTDSAVTWSPFQKDLPTPEHNLSVSSLAEGNSLWKFKAVITATEG